MRRRTGIYRAPVAVLVATALVALGPGTASADENLLEDAVGTVSETITSGTTQQQKSSSEDSPKLTDAPAKVVEDTQKSVTLDHSAPPAPSSDDDSDGHETEDPAAPDHGGATIVESNIGDEEVVRIGDNRATVEDDDSTTAESTLIAIGGEEVIGASADSEGENEDAFDTAQVTQPVCEGSDGQVCLEVLYADAEATEDGETSYSHSSSGIASACAGGDDPSGDTCSGPIEASTMSSEAESERDQQSGRTTASSESSIAAFCLERDPVTGMCAVGGEAVHSEGEADSGNSPGSASRDSYIGALVVGGEEQGRIGDPQDLSLPPGCPDAESLLCLFLNQGETYVGDGVAGHAQEALHLDILPGNLDGVVHLARTETLVHNDGGERRAAGAGGPDNREVLGAGASGGPGSPGAAAGGPVDTAAPAGGVLPNTGGVWSGLIALALLGMGAGAFLMAYSRRRMGAAV